MGRGSDALPKLRTPFDQRSPGGGLMAQQVDRPATSRNTGADDGDECSIVSPGCINNGGC